MMHWMHACAQARSAIVPAIMDASPVRGGEHVALIGVHTPDDVQNPACDVIPPIHVLSAVATCVLLFVLHERPGLPPGLKCPCWSGSFLPGLNKLLQNSLPGLNKSLRAMARASTVINTCYPLNIAPVEVPRFRAVNEEVSLQALLCHCLAAWLNMSLPTETTPSL